MPTHERPSSAESDEQLSLLFKPINDLDTITLDDLYNELGNKQAKLGNELRLMQAKLEIIGYELTGRDDWIPF